MSPPPVLEPLPLPVLGGIERVVVTAAYGDRDFVGPAGRAQAGWRLIAFTDAAAEESIEAAGWEVIRRPPLLADPNRSAKVFKVLTHRIFPDARFSCWIDANFSLDCDLDELIERQLRERDLAVHAHPERDCLYAELDVCVERQLDEPAVMRAQVARYASAGYPRGNGLAATGVLLRRHSAAVRALGEAWWAEISAGSRRDQLSFDYVAWRHRVPYARLDSHVWRGPLFRVRPHAEVARAQLAAAARSA